MRQYIDRLGYKPRTCVWELTLACNATCRHCASRAGKARQNELDTTEALRVARELAALGCEHVTLSGGEPLLRRDWPTIARTLVDAGVDVGLISNGLAFGPREAKQAVDAGLTSVAFSVDGLEASHDRMRARPGGFKRIAAALSASRDAGLPSCAVTHVHRDNLDELDDLHGWLGGFGVRSWKLQLCNPAGNAAEHREMILEPRDLLRLVPKMVELKGRGLPFLQASDSIGYFGKYEEAMRRSWRPELSFWTGCYAGCRAIGLESHGNVKGCLALPSARNGTCDFDEGNVRLSSLADIWSRPGGFAYNRQFHPRQLTGFCRTCPYGEICRAGCHWTALAQGGTLTENRFCYYRVSVEALRRAQGRPPGAKMGPRRWFVQSIAPAAIVATLGITACWDSHQDQWADEADAAADSAWPEDVVPPADAPVAEAATDAGADTPDVPIVHYGPVPVDAGEDVPPGWYGPPPMDAGETTSTDAATDCPDPCAPITFYGPPPVTVYPPGCVYECGGTETCPTADEACCDCDYMGPAPYPPECEDPCGVKRR